MTKHSEAMLRKLLAKGGRNPSSPNAPRKVPAGGHTKLMRESVVAIGRRWAK